MSLSVANVRKATMEDMGALLALSAAMHVECPHYRQRNYSEKKVYANAYLILNNPEAGGILVAESEGKIVGMLAFVIAEDFFGHDKFATDLCVYVTPEKRGGSAFYRLVAAYGHWVESMGIEQRFLGISTGIKTEQTAGLLERLGFERRSIGLGIG